MNPRSAARGILAILPFTLLAACGSSDQDSAAPQRLASLVSASAPKPYSATIRYTSYGVPHIKAHDFKGAGYGYGYAFAQENICLFAEELVTLHGERARYFGMAGGYLGQLGDSFGNVDSDFFYKLLFTPALASRMKEASSPDARDLAAGFTAGYNRYLREAGTDGLPAACRNAASTRESSSSFMPSTRGPKAMLS